MLATFCLYRFLSQQLVTTRKRPEELIIEIIPVGDDDDGWIFHRRLEHEPSRIKRHAERFARALGVPDYAHATVVFFTTGHSARKITAMRFGDARLFLNASRSKR